MVKRAANSLSPAAVAAAVAAKRFFDGYVYGSPAAARAAKEAKEMQALTRPAKPKAKKAKKKAPAVPMTSKEVVITQTHSIGTTAGHVAITLRGDRASGDLDEVKADGGKIVGVRVEVLFPLTSAKVRWAVAAVKSLSDGQKTPAQVKTVVGAKDFNESYLDKWVAVEGIKGPIAADLEDGNTAVMADDLKIVVVAFEASAAVPNVTIKYHVTCLVRGGPSKGVMSL